MYDVIVIGAGPAGSAAARAASKAGLKVLIIEKEIFPRYKPCGGALSDRAISILDFSLPESFCERTITSIKIHFHDKISNGYNGCRLATLVTRSKFDHFLLQKAQEAGADLVTQKVQNFKEKADHIEVLTKKDAYESRFLVISSGYQDSLKERIRERDKRDQYGVSIVTEVEEDDEKIVERLHDSLDFYFDVVETGYGWIFPHKGYYSVGIWGQASRLKDLRGTMAHFLRKNGFQGNYMLHGHKAPLGGHKWKISSPRVLLAGDSAGLVDAFTGEGIYYALRSGQIAAHTIWEQDPVDVSQKYEAICKKEFGKELGYALWITKSLTGHQDTFERILTCDEQVPNKYIEVAAGKKTYKDFVGWLIPRFLENYVDDCNDRIDKLPIILRNLFGNERLNIKIILENGNVLRFGCETENAHVKMAVEDGVPNPTLILVATEGAITRIKSSRDIAATFRKELESGRIAVKGNNLAIRMKLDITHSSMRLMRFVQNLVCG
ncbi:MAG: geranylgeranyl reductase family protein [Methanotrichaceae archaeon]|nr:geranylgeranyl reductase family protein [Methanotrichaceae archaeon]